MERRKELTFQGIAAFAVTCTSTVVFLSRPHDLSRTTAAMTALLWCFGVVCCVVALGLIVREIVIEEKKQSS